MKRKWILFSFLLFSINTAPQHANAFCSYVDFKIKGSSKEVNVSVKIGDFGKLFRQVYGQTSTKSFRQCWGYKEVMKKYRQNKGDTLHLKVTGNVDAIHYSRVNDKIPNDGYVITTITDAPKGNYTMTVLIYSASKLLAKHTTTIH